MEQIKSAFNILLQNAVTPLFNGTATTINLETLISDMQESARSCALNQEPIKAEASICLVIALALVQCNSRKSVYTLQDLALTQVIRQIQDHCDYIIPARQMDRAK